MLLLGFESHVVWGWTFDSSYKDKKKSRPQLLRASINSSVGKRNSMRVDTGKKGLEPSRDKNNGPYSSGERVEKPVSPPRI